MTEFTYREMEKCAAREVAMRRNVFAKRGWNDVRTRELAIMEAIAAHFKQLADRAAAQAAITRLDFD